MACTERCKNAKSLRCRCSCGGMQHGSTRQLTLFDVAKTTDARSGSFFMPNGLPNNSERKEKEMEYPSVFDQKIGMEVMEIGREETGNRIRVGGSKSVWQVFEGESRLTDGGLTWTTDVCRMFNTKKEAVEFAERIVVGNGETPTWKVKTNGTNR